MLLSLKKTVLLTKNVRVRTPTFIFTRSDLHLFLKLKKKFRQQKKQSISFRVLQLSFSQFLHILHIFHIEITISLYFSYLA